MIRAFLYNTIWAYIIFGLCRLVFVMEHWSLLAMQETTSFTSMIRGALVFDTSALLFLLAPYCLALLMPIPTMWKTGKEYGYTLKTLYVTAVAIAVISNLCDVVYFPYTGRRTTATVFGEFAHEDNLLSIFAIEALHHWYVVLAGLAMLYVTWRMYRPVHPFGWERSSAPRSALFSLLCLAAYVPCSIAGMRGGWTTAVRPITISNAFQYADTPGRAAAVLNTPFSLIRTWGKDVFHDPEYYTQAELDSIYSPIHPKSEHEPTGQNVVVFICESMGQEYFGYYNDYDGHTPFLDSLCAKSLTFKESYANGRKSIDGMPSVLSSIPMMGEPFLLTPAAMNRVGGLARELSWAGYETAFFHGAENGSMGFEAFAHNSGFQHYYGRTEYNKDERFNGENDFDGLWAIWDEPFLQFMEKTITDMYENGQKEGGQPFLAAVFTASSHHPYHIPEKYKKQFPEDATNPMHHCIRYLDYSLQRFFEAAKKEAWYDNTLFVLTGDHTNVTSHQEYQTMWGFFSVPVIFYDPTGTVFVPKMRNGPAQQIDIMPTLLSAVGHQRPYVAFGQDVLSTPDSLMWAATWLCGLQMKGGNDALKKAVEQSYMQRMIGDSLVTDNR